MLIPISLFSFILHHSPSWDNQCIKNLWEDDLGGSGNELKHKRFHSLFIYNLISKLTCSILQSFFDCLSLGVLKIIWIFFFSRIKSPSFLWAHNFYFLQKHSRVCCVVLLATKRSLSHESQVPILIQCKGESNIAHYFHMPVVSAVVLHHCKLSSVQIPKKEMCLWGWEL